MDIDLEKHTIHIPQSIMALRNALGKTVVENLYYIPCKDGCYFDPAKLSSLQR